MSSGAGSSARQMVDQLYVLPWLRSQAHSSILATSITFILLGFALLPGSAKLRAKVNDCVFVQ